MKLTFYIEIIMTTMIQEYKSSTYYDI